MNKKGASDILKTLVGVGLLLIIVNQLGLLDLSKYGIGEAPDLGLPPAGLAPDGVCPIGAVIEDTTVTLDARELYNIDTSVGDLIYYRLNDEYVGYADDGDEITFSPGDDIEWCLSCYGNSTESGSGYLGMMRAYSVPCRGTDRVTLDAADMSTAMVALTIQDEDGTTKANGTSTAIGLGGTHSFGVKLKGTYQDHFGVDKPLVCVEWNNTAFTDVEFTALEKASRPGFMSTASLYIEECWYIPGGVIKGDANTGFMSLYVKTSSTTNPCADESCGTNITICAVDDDWYVDGDDGNKFKIGYQDEDNNNIGRDVEECRRLGLS